MLNSLVSFVMSFGPPMLKTSAGIASAPGPYHIEVGLWLSLLHHNHQLADQESCLCQLVEGGLITDRDTDPRENITSFKFIGRGNKLPKPNQTNQPTANNSAF